MTNAIDSYLLTRIEEDDRKRGVDIFSPSLISKGCLIALIMDKLHDGITQSIPTPKQKRIFENGDDVHERLQRYSVASGVMKFVEVALKHPTCGMYGTSDGLALLERYGDKEIVIGEYKSINKDRFANDLKGGAKIDHINQATMYTGMTEMRRQHLRKKYKTEEELNDNIGERIRYYKREYFNHIVSGRKFTRIEKLKHLIGLALKVDDLLWQVEKPIERFTILYECKDNQELKEFEYTMDKAKFQEFVQLCLDTREWLKKYDKVTYDNIEYFQRRDHILPKRNPEFKKSCSSCQFCNYKDFCYNYIEVDKGEEGSVRKKKKATKESKNPIRRSQARRKKA